MKGKDVMFGSSGARPIRRSFTCMNVDVEVRDGRDEN